MELATNYTSLELRNPLVASASPLSHTVEGVRRLAAAGVGAIVLSSLFEEQLREEAELNARLTDAGTESFAESPSYFPGVVEEEPGPRRHLMLVDRAAAAVDVPVIGSLNDVTPGGWTEYARAMQDAGAGAIEPNIYYLPGDPSTPGRDVEQRYVDVLQRVKDAVTVPVAVKLGPYFSSAGEIALRLDDAGADGLVLFDRFLQPDIDLETLAAVPSSVALSGPVDAGLPRTWIALLRGRVRAALAPTQACRDLAPGAIPTLGHVPEGAILGHDNPPTAPSVRVPRVPVAPDSRDVSARLSEMAGCGSESETGSAVRLSSSPADPHRTSEASRQRPRTRVSLVDASLRLATRTRALGAKDEGARAG